MAKKTTVTKNYSVLVPGREPIIIRQTTKRPKAKTRRIGPASLLVTLRD